VVSGVLGGVLDMLADIDCPDALVSFFTGLRGFLTNGAEAGAQRAPGADPASELGLFIRRCLVLYDGLSFEVGSVRLPG
jgi:hypothetical protein